MCSNVFSAAAAWPVRLRFGSYFHLTLIFDTKLMVCTYRSVAEDFVFSEAVCRPYILRLFFIDGLVVRPAASYLGDPCSIPW